MRPNFFTQDIRKAMLKVRLLSRIKKSRVNAYMLLKEISSRPIASRLFKDSSELKNTVYNTLNSLERSGYIKSTKKVEKGRTKYYYAVTAKGNAVLSSARTAFKRHAKEISALFKD